MLVSVDFTALIKWKIGDLVFDVGCDAPFCRPNSPVDRSVATFPGNFCCACSSLAASHCNALNFVYTCESPVTRSAQADFIVIFETAKLHHQECTHHWPLDRVFRFLIHPDQSSIVFGVGLAKQPDILLK